ncbi:MAG: hypothetical protein LQ346_007712 [Caloplaca aetnensis]|nr:MAG: hypothetical protein LQ346_007712 [Caloplaca aetnensis]
MTGEHHTYGKAGQGKAGGQPPQSSSKPVAVAGGSDAPDNDGKALTWAPPQQHAAGGYMSLMALNGNLGVSPGQTSPITRVHETASPTAKTAENRTLHEGSSEGRKSRNSSTAGGASGAWPAGSVTVQQHRPTHEVLFGIGSQFQQQSSRDRSAAPAHHEE